MNDTETRNVEFPFTLTRDGDGDGLTLEGYAAVFNSPAHIRDYDGEYDEVIVPGAFKRTIAAKTPTLMFNHGRNPLWENMPIGKISELREDPRGLFVRARLTDNWLIHPIRDAIRDEAVTGMSIRFEVPEGKSSVSRRKDGIRLRTIHEVKLYELGPVTSPAYEDTVVAVRSLERVAPAVNVTVTSETAYPTETDVEERDESSGTSEELAPPEGTSGEPAILGDPAPSHSPSTYAARQQRARQIIAGHKIGRK